MVQEVKLEIRPLFLPQLVRLINMISPALNSLTWVSSDWKPFVDNVNEAVQNFKILVSCFNQDVLQYYSSLLRLEELTIFTPIEYSKC